MVQLPLVSVVSEPAAAVDTESVSKQRTVAPEAGSPREVAAEALPSLLNRLLPPLLPLLVTSVPLRVAFATVVPPVSVPPVSVLPVSVLPVSVLPVSVLLVAPPPPPLHPAAINVTAIMRVTRVRKKLFLPEVFISI